MSILLWVAYVLTAFVLLGPGYLAPANEGVLERVVEVRVAKGWGLSEDIDVDRYDCLLATVECEHLGQAGWLISESGFYFALVVDCASDEDKQAMREGRLLADVNVNELGHERAVLFLRR